MTTSTTSPYNPSQSMTYQPDNTSNAVYSAEGIPLNDTTPPTTTSLTSYSPNKNAPQESPAEATAIYQPSKVSTVMNQRYVDVGSRKPVMLTYCPTCAKQQISTHTRTKATGTTWVCVLAGVFIFWPLCWLPLVIQPMKQTNHYCNGCGAKVGRVKPFQ